MANKKITDYSLISSLTDTVNLICDDTLQSYRTTMLQVYNYIRAFGMIDIYQAGKTYAITDYAVYSGTIYKSISATNLGNTPGSSPTKWISLSDYIGPTASSTIPGLVTTFSPTETSGVSSPSNADVTQTVSDGFHTYLVTTGNTNRAFNFQALNTSAGRKSRIKKVDSGTGIITLTPPSGTIDGASTAKIASMGESAVVVSDGTNLHFLDRKNVIEMNSLAYTFAASGTVSNDLFFSQRVGGYLVVHGTVTLGTTTASTWAIIMPSGITIDLSRINVATGAGFQVGTLTYVSGNSTAYANSGVLFSDDSTSDRLFFCNTFSSGNLNNENGSFFSSNLKLKMEFRIPVTNWES